jgi:hypothetical protein
MPIKLRYRRGSFLQELDCESVAEAVGHARAMRDAGTAVDFAILENGRAVTGDFGIRLSLGKPQLLD